MTASRSTPDALRSSEEGHDLADRVARIQAEEISRAPVPGRLRAADILEVRS